MNSWSRTGSICGVVLIALASAVGTAAAQDRPEPKTEQPGKESPGRTVFMQARCYACHGEYGNGGVGPRFRENRFLGMGEYVVGQILLGRSVMPAYDDALNDNQIADVATYIRNSWGNQFGPVKPAEVGKVRQNVKLNPAPGRPQLPPIPDEKKQ
jgi:mono/diheme cytochrome c family protein